MKLQKVFVVLGISVCLIAAEMQATFGIEDEPGQGEDLGVAEETVPGEAATADELQGTEGSFEPVQPVMEAVQQQPVVEPVQPVEEPVQQPAAESVQPVEEPVQQPTGEVIQQPSEGTVQQPTGEVIQQPAEGTAQQPAGEVIQQPAEDQPVQTPGNPVQTPAEDNVQQPSGEQGQAPADGADNQPVIPADDNALNNGNSGEESTAGEESPKDDGGMSGELPKEEDNTGTEEPPQDGNLTDTEENPGDIQAPGEEPSQDGTDTGTEELPKDDNATDIEGTPGGIEDPGEEPPQNEIDAGLYEKPEEGSGIKDVAGDTRYEADNGAQVKKKTGIAKDKPKRGSMFSNFAPSSEFIDNREKVKYNVEVPVSGLPGFITQEMVVGALKCQDETGYPASVTIAQIIQESGFGKYGPEGDKGQGLSYLAYQYNNLFGIKGSGTAGSVDMNTGEQRADGSRYSITAGFRVYNTYTECIEDRSALLERVYKDLTFGVKDANTFAVRIGQRWATSLSYGENLIQQMNRYDLYRLDAMTLDEFSGLIGTFANPCPGARLTSSFGHRAAPTAGASTYHKGIDMGTGAYHIPTYAALAGTVTYAGPSGAAGNMVTIDHGNGMVTKYMHHDKVYVKPGDWVEKGQQIGLSGTTGNSTGNHLHFQVEKDGVAIDPLLYLDIQQQ